MQMFLREQQKKKGSGGSGGLKGSFQLKEGGAAVVDPTVNTRNANMNAGQGAVGSKTDLYNNTSYFGPIQQQNTT